jgi:hypothetical protein
MPVPLRTKPMFMLRYALGMASAAAGFPNLPMVPDRH